MVKEEKDDEHEYAKEGTEKGRDVGGRYEEVEV